MYLSRRALIAAGLTLLDVTTAQAATFPLRTAGNWPQKPVKFIIPNAPGSSVDTIGRLLMIEMAKSLQQAAVADNKAGAAARWAPKRLAFHRPMAILCSLALPLLFQQPPCCKKQCATTPWLISS